MHKPSGVCRFFYEGVYAMFALHADHNSPLKLRLKWYVGIQLQMRERYREEVFQEERARPLLFGAEVVQEGSEAAVR